MRREWPSGKGTFGVAAFCVATCLAALMAVVVGSPRQVGAVRTVQTGPRPGARLVTGKSISPYGTVNTNVGSYPMHAVLSPNGRFALISDIGSRAYLSVVDVQTGALASRMRYIRFGAGLYYGIAFGPVAADGSTLVYISHGSSDTIGVLSLSAAGVLGYTGHEIKLPESSDEGTRNPAGLAVSADGRYLYCADNTGIPDQKMRGAFDIFDTASGKRVSELIVPGYPYAVAAVGNRVYLTSEQRGRVVDVDVSNPAVPRITHELHTGSDPVSLVLNRAQTQLFVANASSDTVTVIETSGDMIDRTILLRPPLARALPGATPLGMALSTDEKRLYVTLADMNAIAVVDIASGKILGYVPTAWYPTDVVASPDGRRLLVTCARGIQARVSNAKPLPYVERGIGRGPQFSTNILEGTASSIDLPAALRNLRRLTDQTFANNSMTGDMRLSFAARLALTNPGIKHILYIIKENRTYDQVLGDIPKGNGDPFLCLYGRDITPNLHALAERFVLLDNFYCCAEVSGDGWNWSTAGMASHYVSRNVPYEYSHKRPYDFEGANNGVAVERIGINDVARAPGGYLWDDCDRAGVTFRNYGFFNSVDGTLPAMPAARTPNGSAQEVATLNVLAPNTDPNYRQFDMRYPDSDAMVKYGLKYPMYGLETFGVNHATSRFDEFQREYRAYVRSGDAPTLMLLRLPHDHTWGTNPGLWSPRSMVADNDYAVGEIVDMVSHGPFWKDTAIFIVEDDAQDGYDHVDAHRSTLYVVSPFVERGFHDSRFYNTDSILHTIECLLGLDSMSQYDAIAPTLNVFSGKPLNKEAYRAILPSKTIIGEFNGSHSYRAADSRRMLNPLREDSKADEELNTILWRVAKGPNVPFPEKRYAGVEGYAVAPLPDDDDGDGDDDGPAHSVKASGPSKESR